MKFLVIGGDAAGMSAASRARRTNPALDVTVLEKTTDVSYSACGMPYNIAEPSRDIEDLVVRQAKIFREKQGINLLTGHCANAIETGDQIVTGTSTNGEEFEIPYDKLMIATGASPIVPELPGFDLPGVFALKTLEDGRKIKNYIKANHVKKVVIIGMGFIALEMCESLTKLDIDVNMVKPGSIFLPWLGEMLAKEVKSELESRGVGVFAGNPIERIEKSGVKENDSKLNVICTDLKLNADLVLVAIGIRPNSHIAKEAGIQLSISNSISVNKNLLTSNENIYSGGDCADAFHVVTTKKTWIPLALRANRAGWAVADNICGKDMKLQGVAGTAVFRVFDFEVARTGLTSNEALEYGFNPVEVSIKTRSRAHAHPGSQTIWVQMIGDKDTGRLLGVNMVGKEGVAHRINGPAVALYNHMTVASFSQTDLAYAPPFGPTWDPMLTASNQLLKKL